MDLATRKGRSFALHQFEHDYYLVYFRGNIISVNYPAGKFLFEKMAVISAAPVNLVQVNGDENIIATTGYGLL